MPVARSDPRRATIIAVAGVLFSVAMIVLVLFVNSTSKDVQVGSSSTEFPAGHAEDRAKDVARQPLLFPDPANGDRPIILQHVDADPLKGWVAFDATVADCPGDVEWHADARDFTDCKGRHYPADGTGLFQYPVRLDDKGNLFINLHPEVPTTTTPPATTETIVISGTTTTTAP
jgi:hypothetical protein